MQKIALVVDDSRVARMTLKKLLSAYQFEVVEMGSGENALDHLQTTTIKPDIIFMDVMMGGMDGLTATQRIKHDPTLKDIPVIICTGNDSEEDRSRALEVGAVTALTKPPVADVLAKIISEVEQASASVHRVIPDDVIPAPKVETAPIPTPEPTATEFNEAEMLTTVLANVEQHFLPKIEQEVRKTAEDISRQIVGETIESVVQELLKGRMERELTALTEKLSTQTEQIAEKVAQQASTVVVQERAIEAASHAVQVVVDDADITTQVTQFLSDKGEEWLTAQEEDLGTQLTAQLDLLIPSVVNAHLETKLEEMVVEIVNNIPEPSEEQSDNGLSRNEVEELINQSLNQHTNSVVSPIVSDMVSKQLAAQELLEQDEGMIDSLNKQVSQLRTICFGLGVAVVGLIVATVL